MLTVESTLDTADEALATLNSGLEVAATATGQAAASADTVAAAVAETVKVVGVELPQGIT